jgi:mRNA interferase RelE/StbE
MTWRIEWTDHALKDARRLDRPIRERIVEAIERLAEAGQGDVVRLQAPLTGYRLRVGDWRVIFTLSMEPRILIVRRIRHRSEAYRR